VGDLPSRLDLFAVGRQYAKGVPNTRINPTIIDVPGSDVNLILGAASLMGEANTASWARCMRSLFIDTAVGDELDRKAYDSFGITRKSASPATVDLSFSRTDFSGGGGTLAAGARVTTAAGAVFALQTEVTFGATDLGAVGSAMAQLVGPTQNVSAGIVTAFLDAPFDSSIQVTNPGPAAGGADAESDAQFRGRIRSYYLTLRRGVIGAIQYAATTIAGVSVSTAYEIENPGSGLPAGAVELIIADDSGNASSSMIQQVKDVLLAFRACGIPVFVSGGTVVFEQVVYQLAFATGVDTVGAASEVRSVAIAVSQFLQPGQSLLRSDLIAAARAVPGVIVGAGALPVPVGDIVPPDNNTIIRLRPQDVSFA
jgi:uncharacterized phage protein gp47/JayE